MFQVFHSIEEAASVVRATAVTIGNFDGLHAGHRCIMRRVVEIAREHDWTPTVLTFSPHPTKVVAPARAPKLLTTTQQRAELMRQEGIENVVVLPFTREIAQLTPEQFVERILARGLHAKAVLVGDNFRFGAGQTGDTHTLARLGPRYGFTVEVVHGVRRRGRMISSSEIRRQIREGNVSLAWRELERPYSVEGVIVPGHGVGSRQTVPTLNLSTEAEVLPATGVYITCTEDLDAHQRWDSITNVGYRPTFDGDRLTIETYLLTALDGAAPQRIRLSFLRRVRDERRFRSPEALKAQILKDVSRAQTYFRRCRRWVRRQARPAS
jgi:riboflavin kinase/FMN adenylyltransferase